MLARATPLVLVLLAGACAGSSNGSQIGADAPAGTGTTGATAAPTTTMPSVLAGRPNTVGHEQRTFVDPGRTTSAGKPVGDTPGSPEQSSRTLVTEIYYPNAPGPRPLILFSHGSNGHPDKFTRLLTSWAEAGYVVAAPAFPLTNSKAIGGALNNFDVWDQPGDISFVLDQVLAAAAKNGDALAGRVDPNRLGAAGLSLGGATTYSLAFNECCREPRFKAFEIFDGALLPMPKEYLFDHSVPLLVMHGDNDPTLPYSGAVNVFARAQPPRYLVTLHGSFHSFAFEDYQTPFEGLVQKTTVAFWDTYLAGEAQRQPDIATEATVEGLSAIQTG